MMLSGWCYLRLLLDQLHNNNTKFRWWPYPLSGHSQLMLKLSWGCDNNLSVHSSRYCLSSNKIPMRCFTFYITMHDVFKTLQQKSSNATYDFKVHPKQGLNRLQLEAMFLALATNCLRGSFWLCWTLRNCTKWTAELRVKTARDLTLASRVSSVLMLAMSLACMSV